MTLLSVQDMGWASDALAVAAVLVKAELSAAPPPSAKQSRLPNSSRALAAALSTAAEALSGVIASSSARAALIAKQLPETEVTLLASYSCAIGHCRPR